MRSRRSRSTIPGGNRGLRAGHERRATARACARPRPTSRRRSIALRAAQLGAAAVRAAEFDVPALRISDRRDVRAEHVRARTTRTGRSRSDCRFPLLHGRQAQWRSHGGRGEPRRGAAVARAGEGTRGTRRAHRARRSSSRRTRATPRASARTRRLRAPTRSPKCGSARASRRRSSCSSRARSTSRRGSIACSPRAISKWRGCASRS